MQLAVANRDLTTRVDVLRLSSDAFPVPNFTATVLVDHRANTATIWSAVTHRYYVQRFVPGADAERRFRNRARPPSAVPRPAGGSPLKNLDVLSMSVKLTGHGKTVGVATTGSRARLRARRARRARAGAPYEATVQLADDYPFFPMAFDATIDAGTGTQSRDG